MVGAALVTLGPGLEFSSLDGVSGKDVVCLITSEYSRVMIGADGFFEVYCGGG